MSDDKLKPLREQIDAIDAQIVDLLNQRARVAQEVGHVKAVTNAPVFRPEREAMVLRRVAERNPGPLASADMQMIFREVMSICRALERRVTVAYLGPAGTFSEQAVYQQFGHAVECVPCVSIDEVFRATEAGTADFGVVPVENSGQGMIQITLDMFLTSEATICGEVELRVHQCLHSLAGKIEDVKRVYAHAQSLQQCKTWLRINLPDVACIAVGSNAEAARMARHADDAAAIAGETAGKIYGLKTLATGIEDRADNTTRFLVIGRSLFPPSGNDRTSLLVTVNDQPGALYAVLSPFAKNDVSLNRIESRPAHTGKWQYAFFIDVSGHIDDERLQAAVGEISETAATVRVLGSYPVALP